MSRKTFIAALAVPLVMAGCANVSNYRPLIDTKGVDGAQYEQDLRECRAYAQRINPQSQAVMGAIVGALATAATVAIAMDSGDYLGRSAGVGAVAGAAEGGGSAVVAQRRAVHKCLDGRGYSVLQ
ncbi:glycine zipper family protein [Halomonas organivorans]|uniref:Outer membrane lipoprotein SlyB n=1 Tax=Halomonas organivorans TaxID=257772 RepID=A0A7W5G6Q9_9GAMM|nr:glycine zipper family protein [Halomonas organivorans]MBB3142833.1 outer membrane lipoprotein SlyB [Halomonas organivorans]